MSEKITFAHAIVGMFLEMSAADGSMDDSEMSAIGQMVGKQLGPHYSSEELDDIIATSFKWWASFESTKDRVGEIIRYAVGMQEALSKDARIMIAKGLANIAVADDKVHENEKILLSACLKCMGLTIEDIK
jgi:uncharacterized tellurite resistance protein B-like protein|tara:strand:- start:763 stop:1155 length:393 start_codon:yes stop_codon:yes gene_type:complete